MKLLPQAKACGLIYVWFIWLWLGHYGLGSCLVLFTFETENAHVNFNHRGISINAQSGGRRKWCQMQPFLPTIGQVHCARCSNVHANERAYGAMMRGLSSPNYSFVSWLQRKAPHEVSTCRIADADKGKPTLLFVASR